MINSLELLYLLKGDTHMARLVSHSTILSDICDPMNMNTQLEIGKKEKAFELVQHYARQQKD